MNIYTHINKLEELTNLADFIKYTKHMLIALQENKTLHENVFGMTSDYDHKIEIRSKAVSRLESRYKHLVSELNQLCQ